MENKQSALLNLYHHQQQFGDMEYLFSTVLYHSAPVLFNDKPAVLLTFATSHRNLKLLWDTYRGQFPMTDTLRFYEIKRAPNHVCVLFYSPKTLAATVHESDTRHYLENAGYNDFSSLTAVLGTLRKRSSPCCPHEVGIFLGYPLEDVIGFIENSGKNCIHCGYWKVYADPQAKKEIFHTYDRSRMRMIRNLLSKGCDPLAVLDNFTPESFH